MKGEGKDTGICTLFTGEGKDTEISTLFTGEGRGRKNVRQGRDWKNSLRALVRFAEYQGSSPCITTNHNPIYRQSSSHVLKPRSCIQPKHP